MIPATQISLARDLLRDAAHLSAQSNRTQVLAMSRRLAKALAGLLDAIGCQHPLTINGQCNACGKDIKAVAL